MATRSAALGAAVLVFQLVVSSRSATLQVGLRAAVPVRSLTVAVTQAHGAAGCKAALQAGAVSVAFRSTANCTLPVGTVTVTNGAVQAQVDVAGSDAVPADGGTHWTLCGVADRPCFGMRAQPGTDQFEATTLGGTKKPTTGTVLDYVPACDTAFGSSTGSPSCVAAPGEEAREGLTTLVASASSDRAREFTTAVTWMAVA